MNNNKCVYTLLIFIVTFTMHVSAAEKDTLYLRNGQILIGELKEIAYGRLKFDADDVGLSSIKISKVATLKATTHLYRIETAQKTLYYSSVYPDSTAGHVGIKQEGQIISIPLLSILNTRYYKSASAGLWEGNLSLGYSYTKSSDIGRLNADAGFKYNLPKAEFATNMSEIVTQTDTGWVRENENLSLSGAYYLNYSWQAIALLNYQRNIQLGLKRRFQEGIGIGVNVLSTSNLRLKSILGAILNQEKNMENVNAATVEAGLLNTFTLFNLSKPDINISSTQNVYFGITQAGRIRHDGQIKVTWKVISDFSVNITLYDNYDSQPPGINAANIDYGIVFGVGYSF
ncbi:uncharacterized protein DUF481 [Chitinophaga skermanii]|uniref:Uncharacterized protein DUF481 n=1 Tax=Chitinophaga skermanii TaxID=331697 RepID=A0A327Q6X7_9BACT|nr:DUF481 domain-containing protein [Chitinophaga skermanii]RAI97596.1 uncharacterized protein DUF481 [Chitinophaga skermanii]